MEKDDLIIDTPAIIELFGHTKMAGHVTSIAVGSSAFLRVEVPATRLQKSFTRLINPSAVYAINPCTEEIMKAMADTFNFTPLTKWDLPDSLKNQERSGVAQIESPQSALSDLSHLYDDEFPF